MQAARPPPAAQSDSDSSDEDDDDDFDYVNQDILDAWQPDHDYENEDVSTISSTRASQSQIHSQILRMQSPKTLTYGDF